MYAQLAAARLAATINDGVELRPLGLGDLPYINQWLIGTDKEKKHSTSLKSAVPGTGLYASRDFKPNELVTLYDGDYLEGGVTEANRLSIQTHLARREHVYVDGKPLADGMAALSAPSPAQASTISKAPPGPP